MEKQKTDIKTIYNAFNACLKFYIEADKTNADIEKITKWATDIGKGDFNTPEIGWIINGVTHALYERFQRS